MWWRTRHGRGPPARHHLLEQLPGPAEHPCRVPLAAAHTPGAAPFSRPGLNTHERSGEEPFKRSSEAQNPRSHTAPASLQRSRTQITRYRGATATAQPDTAQRRVPAARTPPALAGRDQPKAITAGSAEEARHAAVELASAGSTTGHRGATRAAAAGRTR